MRIIVESNFSLSEKRLEIQTDTESTTLGDLLGELSKKYKMKDVYEFFDSEHGKIHPECEVLLNEQSYRVLTDGLATKLRDGDKVEIITMLVGG